MMILFGVAGGITLANETTKLVDKIGTPALLELMAEESIELGHACQKAARYLRGENPSPNQDMKKLVGHISEEMADVYVTAAEVRKADIVDSKYVSEIIDFKRRRMNERLGMKAESFIF